jgi:hypothetical protein
MPAIFPDQKMQTQSDDERYRFLLPKHIQMIDEALCSLGEYGVVRLVVEKGCLRFLITQRSYDALKWHPGNIIKDVEE